MINSFVFRFDRLYLRFLLYANEKYDFVPEIQCWYKIFFISFSYVLAVKIKIKMRTDFFLF